MPLSRNFSMTLPFSPQSGTAAPNRAEKTNSGRRLFLLRSKWKSVTVNMFSTVSRNVLPARAIPAIPDLSGGIFVAKAPSGFQNSQRIQVRTPATTEVTRNTTRDQPNTFQTFFSAVSLHAAHATQKKTVGTTSTNIMFRNISPIGFTMDAAGPKMAPQPAPIPMPSRSSNVWT